MAKHTAPKKERRNHLTQAPTVMGQKVGLRAYLITWLSALLLCEGTTLFISAASVRSWNAQSVWPSIGTSLGAFWCGVLLGFFYSTFGRQERQFKVPIRTINALFGGALVADLAKGPASVSATFFLALTESLGIANHALPFLAGLVASAVLGFVMTYYLKIYLLNPLHQQQESLTDAIGQDQIDLINTPIDLDKEGKPVGVSSELRNVAKQIIKIEQTTAPGPGQKLTLARSHFRSGDLAAAEYWYRLAVDEQPANAEPLYELASVLMSRGLYHEAETYLKQLTRMSDHFPNAWNLLAKTLRANGAPAVDIITALAKYIEGEADPDAAFELLVTLSDNAEAIRDSGVSDDLIAKAIRFVKESGGPELKERLSTLFDASGKLASLAQAPIIREVLATDPG